MKSCLKRLRIVLLVLGQAVAQLLKLSVVTLGLTMPILVMADAAPSSDEMMNCKGEFPNFITDVCWSCMMPLRVGGGAFITNHQEDIETDVGSSALCFCSNPVFAGIPVAFWEPTRMIEVVRKPFCFPMLGGSAIPDPIGAPRGERKADTQFGFYQAHWYKSPLAVILEVLLDYDLCLEQGSLDVAYMTELDPLWGSSELTMILNPDVFLFANPIAQAACAADCAASTAGFPLSELFWCAGCQGSMYPLNGQIAHAAGGVPSSALLLQRMNAKLHRELLIWGTWGAQGSCNTYPEPIMDKRAYKFQLISPASTTKFKAHGNSGDEVCCTPMGRAHQVWGLGKELPAGQNDFGYLLFRKRDCCFSIVGL
jgi:conjugal transfer pilus assembly protein TraU